MARTQDNTNEVLAEVDRRIVQKLKIAALLVERTAKLPGYCPRATGTSVRSITHKITPDKRSAIVGSNVEYFPYHELGTSKMAAHASLRRALQANERKIKKLFGAK